MRRRRRAALAVDPARVAVAVVFLFPNWQTVFDFVDDVPTGIERLAAMLGAHADPDRHVADRKFTDAVHAERVLDRKAPQRLGHDAIALFDGQRFECFVFEAAHRLPLVVIAYPSLEARISPGAGIEQLLPRSLGVDCRMRELKSHQPPATGGMKTIASPACRGRAQSLNSLLTATFNCSRASVKP